METVFENGGKQLDMKPPLKFSLSTYDLDEKKNRLAKIYPAIFVL